jgi:hypothetical protein
MTLVATLAEFKTHLNYGTGNTEDTELTMHLSAASQWAESYFALAPTVFTERLYTQDCYLRQRHHPLTAVASVTPQDGMALSASAYIVDTTNSLIELRYNYAGYGWYTAVYTAGLTTITDRVKLAGMIVGQHLWDLQNGSAGRGRRPEDLVPTPFGFAVPNRAIELIESDPDLKTMPGFA